MATLETQQLDQIISSRRAMLMLGGTALAGIALAGTASAQATAPSDADILNFALNLEYLEANYYYAAAFGVTIDKATSAMNGTGPLSINGGASSGGVVASVKASPKVPFTTVAVNSYAIETAIEEGKHVAFLQSALGSAAVAQPAIDLTGGTGYGSTAAWNTLAAAATIGPMFDPFMSDANFLVGAYVFEDVGVTAYHGAAPGISTAGIAKGYLTAAAGILAVEAYHAGLVRTSLTQLDPSGSLGSSAMPRRSPPCVPSCRSQPCPRTPILATTLRLPRLLRWAERQGRLRRSSRTRTRTRWPTRAPRPRCSTLSLGELQRRAPTRECSFPRG
jgi:hypothetical protein